MARTFPGARFAARAPGVAALFALALLLANLAFTWHHYDLAAHRTAHPCSVCAVAGDLGHGLAQLPSGLPARAQTDQCPGYRSPLSTPPRALRPRARAPPR